MIIIELSVLILMSWYMLRDARRDTAAIIKLVRNGHQKRGERRRSTDSPRRRKNP